MDNTTGELLPNLELIAGALVGLAMIGITLRLRRSDLETNKLRRDPPPPPESRTDRVVAALGLIVLAALAAQIVRAGLFNTTNQWFYDLLFIVPFSVYLFRAARILVKKLRGEPVPAPPPESMTDRVGAALGLIVLAVFAALIVREGQYDLPYPLAWLGGLYAAVLLCLAVALVFGTDAVRRVATYSAALFLTTLVALYITGVLSDPLFPVVGYTVFCAALAIYAVFRKLRESLRTY